MIRHIISQRPKTKSAMAAACGVAISALVLLGLTAGSTTATAAPPVAVATCGFATPGTGTYASTICWLDMSAYNETQAQTGQDFAVSISSGYTLSFTLTKSGGAMHATTFPTYSGAYLGNNSHYTGVPGSPALYQTTGRTSTTAALTNISLTNSSGGAETGFALVGADAESTDSGESLSWTSTAPITSLTATSSGNGLGNACGGGFTGVGTTTVKCTGKSTGAAPKTGTAILASRAPSTFSQTMIGNALEGFAFGVLLSSIQLDKTVVGSYAGDAFSVAMTGPSGNAVATANTGGGSTATTGRKTVVVGAAGSTFTFGETATSGSLANYTQGWSCTRNGAADPTLPSGAAGASAPVLVGVGDTVICAITNTGLPRSLGLTKHAGTPVDVNGDGLVDAADQIPFTFTVTNTGQVQLQNIAVSDPKVGAVNCPLTVLDVGVSETCSAAAVYTITAADVTAGAVVNTATASGHAPNSTETVASPVSTTSTPTTAPAPSISIVKSASPSAAATYTAGQPIAYSFVVTNTGNVPLNNVTVNEGAFSGTGTMSAPSCPVTSLAVAAQEVCTATYTLTQADVNAGSITNSATATGTPTGSITPVTSPPSSVTIPALPQPAITIVKSATPGTATAAGQTITYSFLLTNTGNVDLTSVTVDEGAFSGTGTLSGVTCPQATLVPGQAETCTATYSATQADVDAGTVTNDATAVGTPPSGAPIASEPSNATVTFTQLPKLALVKTADSASISRAGQVITYSFDVTNTGNVTVTAVSVTDVTFSGQGTLSAITCPSGALSVAPGDSVVCSAKYTVVTADLSGAALTNTATASGKDPADRTVTSDLSTASLVSTSGVGRVPALARTGVEVSPFAVPAAFALILIGGVILFVRRRKVRGQSGN